MQIVSDFYNNFTCKAGECGHSCCKGWEIDVDEATACYYHSQEGDFGKWLRDALYVDEEGWHFRLDEHDRCPFLKENGLCEIILTLGEDALCDICALHPRFFFEVGELQFAGLGASCEAVCTLLLDDQKPLRFETDQGQKYSFSELLQKIFPDVEVAYRYTFDAERASESIRPFNVTEPIDEDWPKELEALRSMAYRDVAETDRQTLQKIYEYVFYRQMDRIPEYGIDIVVQYAEMCTDFIALHAQLSGDYQKSLRRFSEQIEYSTINVDRVMGVRME